MSEGEIITRRRKWNPAQKAALLEEVESEGGKVAMVARRHGISESLLYNWRSAWKAAACAVSASEPMEFVRLGVVGEASGERRPLLAPPEPERSRHRRRPAKMALERSRLRCRMVSAFVLMAW